MATIRPSALPAAGSVAADVALVIDDGITVQKATPQQVVGAAVVDSAKVSFLQQGVGAVAVDVRSVLRQELRVTDFGADPTGVADSLAAIHAARDVALTTGQELVFPQGFYKVSAAPEFGFPRLHVRGEGRVVIQADFNGGSVVSIDAGPTNIAYQGSFVNFTLRGNGSANQTGLYIRNRVHNYVADVRTRNVTKYAVHILSDVLSVYDRLTSDYQDDGIGSEARPTHDLYLDLTAANGAVTRCAFNECRFEEGQSFGVYLASATNCTFNGGAAEGLPGWAVYVSAASFRNQFNEFYCELNALGDFDILGNRNRFINCEAYDGSQATTQFKVRSGARGNFITGGGAFSSGGVALTTIVIDSGAIDTVVRDIDLYKLTDSGTSSVCENYSDAFNGRSRAQTRVSLNAIVSAANDAAAAAAGVPIGYAYRNGSAVMVRVT